MHVKEGFPAELNDIVMKCLAKKIEERYQTASALDDDLDKFKKKMKFTFDTSDLAKFMHEHFERDDTNASR